MGKEDKATRYKRQRDKAQTELDNLRLENEELKAKLRIAVHSNSLSEAIIQDVMCDVIAVFERYNLQ